MTTMLRFRKAFQWGAADGKQGKCEHFGIDWLAVSAECIGVTFLVVFGCGTAVVNGAFDASQQLMVSFAFGMSVLLCYGKFDGFEFIPQLPHIFL